MADMNPDEIIDGDTLKRWLEGQERTVAVAIAYRAAMRVAPIWFGDRVIRRAHYRDLTSLRIFRQLVSAVVPVVHTTPEVKKATAAVYAAAAYAAAAYADDAAATAADAADAAYADDAYAFENYTFSDKSRLFEVQAFWDAVRADAKSAERGDDLSALPLWTVDPPSRFAPADRDMRGFLAANPALWSFWSRWWAAANDGKPLNWDMQRDIALIPDEDWEKGPAHLAGLIAEKEKRYILEKAIKDNPYALTVHFDKVLGKLVSAPSELVSLSQVGASVLRVLGDFEDRCNRDTSRNNLRSKLMPATQEVLADIRRDLIRYADEPLYLFDALSDAVLEIRSVRAAEGFEGISIFDRLMNGIERSCDDICGASPDVQLTQKRRAAVQLDRFSQNQLALAVDMSRGMQGDSTGYLHAATGAAFQVLLDPNASQEDRKSAWYFVTAMVPRGARAMTEKAEEAAEGETGSTYDSVVVTTVAVLGDADKIVKGGEAIGKIAVTGGRWIDMVFEFFKPLQ